MARTIVAGQPVRSTINREPQDDITAIIWSATAELYRYGAIYAEIGPRRDRLKRHLVKQELRDHPLWPEKKRIFDELDAECQCYDQIAAGLMTILATHYERLSEWNRQRLISGRGWSMAKHPDDWAREVWEQAKTGTTMPEGEPGF